MKNAGANITKYIIAILVLILAAILIIYYKSYIRNINAHDIKRFILSYGEYASICFVIIYSIKPLVFIIPASLLSILAGNIFGPFYSFMLSMISCFFAGTLAFFLSKILGKPFIDKKLKGKGLLIDNNIKENGFIIMLLMRFAFVFPYDELSYAAGMTKMRYVDFIIATLIGISPEMIMYSFMGENIMHPFSMKVIIPIVSVMIIAPTSYYIYRKKYKKKVK